MAENYIINWNLLGEFNSPNKLQSFSELKFYQKMQYTINCSLRDMIIETILSIMIGSLLSLTSINDDQPYYDLLTTENLLFICLIAPIVEELIFRLCLHNCLKHFNVATNLRILIANICFGLIHLSNAGIDRSTLNAISHCVVIILVPTHGKIYELGGYGFACLSHITNNIVCVAIYIIFSQKLKDN